LVSGTKFAILFPLAKRNGRDTAHFFLDFGIETVDLNALLERTLSGMGYELVDVQASSKGRLVRVFIDKPSGIDVEDCARVSDQLTRLFAVENVDYERLEVSSPGLDRLLRKSRDFERFSGEEAQIRLRTMIDNRRNYTGTLRGIRDGNVILETAAGTSELPLDAIERARLVPKIDWSRK
jgi:ribosome maturation factor RimP